LKAKIYILFLYCTVLEANGSVEIEANSPTSENEVRGPEPEYDSDASTNFEEDEDEPLEVLRQKMQNRRRRESQLLTQASQSVDNREDGPTISAPGMGMDPPNRIRISRNPRTILTGQAHANMIASSIKNILVLSKNDDFREEIFNVLGVSTVHLKTINPLYSQYYIELTIYEINGKYNSVLYLFICFY